MDQDLGSSFGPRSRAAAPVEAAFMGLYAELRELARQLFAGERPGHTLQATALLSEAYLRLRACGDDTAADPAQFRLAAAAAMRRILIEHARKKGRVKRGGGVLPASLDSVQLAATGDFEQLIAVDEAIERIAADSPDLAELVRLRFYAGMSPPEIARTLGRSERTVHREWAYAKARLYQLLSLPEP